MKVKICGITRLEDALYAIEAGADALGFIFYQKSPRYITPERAKEIIDNLPPFIERVGLFVNETAQVVDNICQLAGISLAQIHFDADTAFYEALKIKHIRVTRAKSREDILSLDGEYRFIDSFTEAFGGCGKRLNIEWFNDIDTSKIILAGGLTPENVAELATYGFYGFDVSSGVESAPGIKDKEKIKRFISAAKRQQ